MYTEMPAPCVQHVTWLLLHWKRILSHPWSWFRPYWPTLQKHRRISQMPGKGLTWLWYPLTKQLLWFCTPKVRCLFVNNPSFTATQVTSGLVYLKYVITLYVMGYHLIMIKISKLLTYSQTCINGHLYIAWPCLMWPLSGPTDEIPYILNLYIAWPCPTRLAATYFQSQTRKNMSYNGHHRMRSIAIFTKC